MKTDECNLRCIPCRCWAGVNVDLPVISLSKSRLLLCGGYYTDVNQYSYMVPEVIF